MEQAHAMDLEAPVAGFANTAGTQSRAWLDSTTPSGAIQSATGNKEVPLKLHSDEVLLGSSSLTMAMEPGRTPSGLRYLMEPIATFMLDSRLLLDALETL
jgi:hypothetical protein